MADGEYRLANIIVQKGWGLHNAAESIVGLAFTIQNDNNICFRTTGSSKNINYILPNNNNWLLLCIAN